MTAAPPSSDRPPDWVAELTLGVLSGRMGIEIVDWNPDRLVATMPVEGNQQPYGIVHGGAYCVLAESLASTAAALSVGPERAVVGIELNASYHRAAVSGTITAVCRNLHLGATLTSHEIEMTDDSERLLCTVRLRCLVRARPPVG